LGTTNKKKHTRRRTFDGSFLRHLKKHRVKGTGKIPKGGVLRGKKANESDTGRTHISTSAAYTIDSVPLLGSEGVKEGAKGTRGRVIKGGGRKQFLEERNIIFMSRKKVKHNQKGVC